MATSAIRRFAEQIIQCCCLPEKVEEELDAIATFKERIEIIVREFSRVMETQSLRELVLAALLDPVIPIPRVQILRIAQRALQIENQREMGDEPRGRLPGFRKVKSCPEFGRSDRLDEPGLLDSD